MLVALTGPLQAGQSGNFIYSDNGTEITISSYPASLGGAVSIPPSIIGKPVTGIGMSAFANCHFITSVSIPSGVTNIESGAFENCSNLKSAYFMGASPPSMGTAVFSGTPTDFTVYYFNSTTGFSTPTWGGYRAVNLGYTTVNGSKITITGASNNASTGSLDIPGTINSLPVTLIANSAFYNRVWIQSVSIPSSVTGIGSGAFMNCGQLRSAYFYGTVPSSMGASVFQGTSNFTVYFFNSAAGFTSPTWNGHPSVNISYTDNFNQVSITGASDSGSYWSFIDLRIPGTINHLPVTRIEDSAFYNNFWLDSVDIPPSVTSIGSSAFYGCEVLSYITIPSSVTSMGDAVFANCTTLSSVTLPPGINRIGASMFKNCPWLTAITIPSGVTSIGNSAFLGCTGLNNVTIPGSVTSIGDAAFSGCYWLTSVFLPPAISSIGSAAFANCSKLAGVAIPPSVTMIGARAFSNCPALTSISVDGANTNYDSIDGVLFNKSNTSLLQFPGGKTGNYSIPSSVTNIGDYAFASCNNLTAVTIPSGATTIGDYAFSDCNELASVTIPAGVASIGDYAFARCGKLTGTSIPSSVTHIGNSAFTECNSLTNITIPCNTGYQAFSNCRGLTSASLGPNVTLVENSMFYGCSALTSITIPPGVTAIGNSAFNNCTNLKIVSLPSGVVSLGQSAFANCIRLTDIYFQGNAPSLVGSTVFQSVANLTVYRLPGTSGWGTTYGGWPVYVPPPLMAFRVAQGLPVNGTADFLTPAGDGVPNIYKYAFNMIGSEPGQAASLEIPNNLQVGPSGTSGLPTIEFQANGETKLKWTYVRWKSSISPGITYTVEFSNDLSAGSWSPNTSATVTTTDISWNMERVTVTDNISDAGMRFSRVRVSAP